MSPDPRLVAAAASLVALLALVGCGSSGTKKSTTSQSAARGQCAPAAGEPSATTKSYVMTMSAGPPEAMYTMAQVKAMHPKHGEVMLGGSMMTGAGMGSAMPGMGGGMRHVEVRICSRSSGRTVEAHPTMTMIDRSSGKRTTVQVATMQGVGEGRADLHYGNNMALPHHAAIEITVNGQRITLVPPTG